MPDFVTPPLQGGALAIDFANTVWFAGGRTLDALDDDVSTTRWLDAVAERLAHAGCAPGSVAVSQEVRDQLVEARQHVRACLSAVSEHRPVSDEVGSFLNEQTSHAPGWKELATDEGGEHIVSKRRGASVQTLLAALCESAIEVAASSGARACECPNCIGFFPPAPRRRYCSPQCSTRVRVERHRRSRIASPASTTTEPAESSDRRR